MKKADRMWLLRDYEMIQDKLVRNLHIELSQVPNRGLFDIPEVQEELRLLRKLAYEVGRQDAVKWMIQHVEMEQPKDHVSDRSWYMMAAVETVEDLKEPPEYPAMVAIGKEGPERMKVGMKLSKEGKWIVNEVADIKYVIN